MITLCTVPNTKLVIILINCYCYGVIVIFKLYFYLQEREGPAGLTLHKECTTSALEDRLVALMDTAIKTM
jgi:hypothetical protein